MQLYHIKVGTLRNYEEILLNQENPPINKPWKSISFCPTVWADCLYNCADTTHFSALMWWKKRNAFLGLWFESILIIPKNICYILGEEPIFQ